MDAVIIPCPLFHKAQTDPARVALITRSQSFTYQQLDQMIGHLCHRLSFKPGTRIAFIAHPTLETILLFFALFRLQAVACPLSFRLPEQQLETVLAELTPSLFLDPQELPLDLSPSVLSCDPLLTTEQLATCLLTSGSTGKPKIACHPLASYYYNSLDALDPLRLTESSRWGLKLPLFHVSGISILFRCFLRGAAVVLSDLPLLPSLQHMTHISLVPTQLYRLLQHPEQLPTHLQCLLIGGAPLSSILYHQARSHALPLFTTYGMTEMGSIITLAIPDQKQEEPHVGEPLASREIQVKDTQEIYVRGKPLFHGYWNPSTQQYDNPCTEGWFPTKDLGKFDREGKLHIIGRKDRQFISGGENIQPEEIEAALCSIPGILAAHVASYEDPEFGRRPIGYILEETPCHTCATIKEALQDKLPSFKHPTQILPLSDAPKNARMKAGMGMD